MAMHTPPLLVAVRSCSVRLFAVAAAAAVCLGVAGCTKISDKDVLRDALEVSDVAKIVQKGEVAAGSSAPSTLLLDVRTAEAFAAGHLPGARNIRLPEIDPKEKDPDLDRYKMIIVYDQNRGSASGMAVAKRLLIADYDDVRLFEEGFDAWKRAGLPVERSAGAPVPAAAPK